MAKAKRQFTQFYHNVEEALIAARLNGTQMALVLAIQRKTVGWRKLGGEHISQTELSKMTGRHRSRIQVELKTLSKMNIIQEVERPTFGRSAKLKLNDRPESWVLLETATGTASKTGGGGRKRIVTENSTETVTENATHQKKDKRKETKRKLAQTDVRFTSLKQFLFAEYKKLKRLELRPVFKVSDAKALTEMLKDLPDTPIEEFQRSWTAFLLSQDKFYRKMQGAHPVRYWASNINAFLDLATYGDGQKRIRGTSVHEINRQTMQEILEESQ